MRRFPQVRRLLPPQVGRTPVEPAPAGHRQSRQPMDKTTFACGNCGRRLESADSLCPHCGQAAGPPASPAGADASGGNEEYLALVRAGVYRRRRQWDLAEKECSEVLRRNPECADAYSVMGDICRDQNMLRDAIEWYRLALFHNPASVTDRDKLEKAIDALYPDPRPGGKGSQAKASASGGMATTRPCSLTTTVALALAVVFAIAVATALISRQAPAPPETAVPAVASGSFAPAVSPSTGEEPTPAREQRRETDDQMAESLPALEAGLLSHLQSQMTAVDVNCRVDSVEIDPLTSSAAIRFTMPRVWSLGDTRRSIGRAAAALAAESFSFDNRVRAVRLRCDLRGAGANGEVAMLAETERGFAPPGGEPGAGTESAFNALWWHPDLRGAAGDAGG